MMNNYRLLRKYKFCFILGVLIFIFGIQVLLALKSLGLAEISLVSTNSGDHIQTLNKKPTTLLLNISALGFVPSCELTSKDAISALNRAKTLNCKKLIALTACQIQSNNFYPKYLSSDCPKENIQSSKTFGCYKDEKDFRLLSGYFANFESTNSPKKCVALCLQSGFPIAGVQYGTECFCGTHIPAAALKVSDENCNKKCSGDETEFCGGYFTMNIYTTGINKFAPKSAEIIPKPNISKVKIVFLLTLNGRALRQVQRLIKSLYQNDSTFFYIHIDSRQDYLYRELKELEYNFPNIRLAKTRFSTIWGGASLLTMLLQSMKDLYYLSYQWHWDFVINLSESDYPIKKVEKLQDFLTANHGMNFVKSHGRETQRFIQKQGLDKTFVECDNHMWRIGDRVLPEGIQVDGGSDWVALSKDFVEYILDLEGNNTTIQSLLIVFRHTLLPAESFFHTVLKNSKFCGTYIDNNLHITNWKRKLGCKCQYKHVVDWCGCSPNDFKPEDWPRLEGSKHKMLFFARKFEPIINQEVLNKLDEWLYGKNISSQINFSSFWQSIYHYKDKNPVPDAAALTIAFSILRYLGIQLNLGYLNLEEIINFQSNDDYIGFLLTYNSNHQIFQTKIRPNQYPKLARNSKFSKRLRSLEVSTEFDLKEQISRNLPKFIGPHSDPVLSFKFIGKHESNNHSYNLTVLWIDPTNSLQDYSEIHVEDSVEDTINYSKSSLKHPVTPGIWTVKLIGRTNLFAETKFLVTPLSCDQFGKPLSDTKVNSGSRYNDLTYPAEWEQHLASKDKKNILEATGGSADKLGTKLFEWIDELVYKFYTIIETCSVNRTYSSMITCNSTNWSSFAPDPKSDLYALSKLN